MCVNNIIVCVLLLSVWLSCAKAFTRHDCPGGGYDSNGYWGADYKDGDRCILKCDSGYQPSGCNVLRQNKDKSWNYKVPVCETESVITGSNVLIAGVAGAAAVAAAPVALAAAGFTAAGVAAGSLAAFLQTPFTAVGSWFAASQSAGVLGLAATTQAGIGAAASGATYAYLSSHCEKE